MDLGVLLLKLPEIEQGNLSQGKNSSLVDRHVALTCLWCAVLSPLRT